MKPETIRRLPRSLRCKVHPGRLVAYRGLCYGCLKAEQRAKAKERKRHAS